ncbi:MAG: hypothetical protein WC657_05775, partial [Candidatus Paceibacterota bacterium]
MNGQVRRLVARVRRAFRDPAPDMGGAIVAAQQFHIEDGVDYRQPPVLPAHIAQQGTKATLAYLTETDQGTYRGQFDQSRSVAYEGPVAMP